MNLIELHPSAIGVGVPIPVPLRDEAGRLLLARGAVIETEFVRQQLVARGIYVDETEAASFAPAMAGKLHVMLHQDALLSEIANALSSEPAPASTSDRTSNLLVVWSEMVARASQLLVEAPGPDFVASVIKLDEDLFDQVERDADGSLLYLVHQVIRSSYPYSAKHSLLVAVVCELASRHLKHWPDGCRSSLRCAAITMNIAMTQLQDELATQRLAPTPDQREQIKTHARRGVEILISAGVNDPLWLDAVAMHHETDSGSLANMTPANQLARMLQRADIFTARLSPREGRQALSAHAAAQSAYLDEKERADLAGAAIVKAVGLYPPGTNVRLDNGEVAMVLRRGQRADQPIVVSILSSGGVPIEQPALRDTRITPYGVVSSVPPHELNVAVDLEMMFDLLSQPLP